MIRARKNIIGRKQAISLNLVHNSENPSLDALSFVLENIPEDKGECDIAPAFKNLTDKCIGKKLA